MRPAVGSLTRAVLPQDLIEALLRVPPDGPVGVRFGGVLARPDPIEARRRERAACAGAIGAGAVRPQCRAMAAPPLPPLAVDAAWWSLEADALRAALGSGPQGLPAAEAARRLAACGPNAVAAAAPAGALRLLGRQLASPLVLILLVASLLSLLLRGWGDAANTLAIVGGSALLGFTQELRASQAVARLQQRLALVARVRRDGQVQALPARELLPGDLIELAAGQQVPADGRVLEARDFLVNQASLTGESFPVEKSAGTVASRSGLPLSPVSGAGHRARRLPRPGFPQPGRGGCMDVLGLSIRLLLLLAVANMAPIGATRLLGARWSRPLDGGRCFVDGRPLLGPSKTWRGLAAAVLGCALVAPLLGLPAAAGAGLGLMAMAGDAASSFVKRRLGIASGGRATGLDQVPEALLPLLALRPWLPLPWWALLGVVLVFFVLERPLARWAHRHGLRRDPH